MRDFLLRSLKHKSYKFLAVGGSTVAVVALILILGAQKNFGPQQYGQLIVAGLGDGAIYALIALGFVMIYTVTGIINFAQGAFVMLGSMIAVTLYASKIGGTGATGLIVAALLAIVATTAIGVIVERLTIFPARNADSLTLIIITVGVYITLQGLALIFWGSNARILPAFTTVATSDLIFRPGGIVLKAQSLWIWGTTAVVLALLMVFLRRTLLGKALRACSVNRYAARLMGISPSRMSIFAFGLAAAMGAVAGIVLAPASRPIYDMGLKLGLKGFVAAAMGGLVSSPVAVLGGLLLGLTENIAAGVTKSGLKDIFAFIVLIAVLLRQRRQMGRGLE
ncbi:MAG: branched-chain amino acid ABC transporter permease [Actinobacteria bacterium]|nr:branched-chain amino acid ABC transporter permease [Actinomycetota bacterium]